MKLKEAIEIAQDPDHYLQLVLEDDQLKAIEILIEAGKREELCRHNLPPDAWDLLPGETKG